MSQFSFNDYQNVVAQAEANANGNGTKVGYFKLKNDGDIAIARLNIGSTDDLDFASVHTIGMNGKWIKVSCLNPLGSYAGDCALCGAHTANPKGSISKAAKKVFIQMMVSYRDTASATGYTAPAPVIWDRPAAFSRELANKLMIAGDLRNTLVLITRNGKAGDMQTTYSVDVLPATHPVFKPEMIPADFSAFNNFNIAKHSYWEKSAEEINTFLTTGQFPERQAANTQQAVNNVAAVASAYTAPATAAPTYAAPVQPATPAYVAPAAPQQAPAAPAYTAPSYTQPAVPTAPVSAPGSATTAPGTPVRNFSGFSF
jgi:hypothetical protein